MAWSIRGAGGEQEGLTIYQVQELLRSRKLTADDQATQDGTWVRVGDHPILARYLPEAAPPTEPGEPGIDVHGIRLQVGPDGKPLPPDAATIASLLSATSERPPDPGTIKRIRRMLTVFVAILFVAAMFLALRMLQFAGAQP